MGKIRVLFVCADNSARSQIAQAFLNTYFGNRFEAHSAGVIPSQISPRIKKVLQEIGIDVSKCSAKNIKEFQGKEFDCIVTLCDYAKTCSLSFPKHKKELHKNLKAYCDPVFCEIAKRLDVCPQKGKKGVSDRPQKEEDIIAAFRRLREEIFEWLEKEAVF